MTFLGTIALVLVISLSARFWHSGTTLSVSWWADSALFGCFLLLYFLSFDKALHDRNSPLYRWDNRRPHAMFNRKQRRAGTAAQIGLCLVLCGMFSWIATRLLAQFLGGEPGSIGGVVIATKAAFPARQSCRLVIFVRTDLGDPFEICHADSPTVPRPGQRLTVITAANWAGLAVQRVEF